MLTPKSSAPPEATRPGRIVSCAQSRPPASPTSPGPKARKTMPRRIGTTRQTEARSTRSRPRRSVAGGVRALWVSLSIRSSSRGCRRAARCAAPAAERHEDGDHGEQDHDGRDEPRPVPRLGRQRREDDLRARQRVEGGADQADEIEPAGGQRRWRRRRRARSGCRPVRGGPPPPPRPRPAPRRWRRAIQSTMTSWAPHRPPGPLANAIDPSRAQVCTSHATFSGVSSSAPRWSVVGLTGNVDALLPREQLAATARRDAGEDADQQEGTQAPTA